LHISDLYPSSRNRARATAQATRRFFERVDEIRSYTSAVASATNLIDVLKVRIIIGRLNALETIFNYVRAGGGIRTEPVPDDTTRAFWQINKLANINIDASGADLRQLKLQDLDVLDGVIWTSDTVWPTGLARIIRTHSEEIEPGVYRIRFGDDRDPTKLAVGV
jgi:hypothetical protein